MAISSNKLAKVSAILMIALVCLAFCQQSDAPVQNGENTLGNLQKDQITASLRMLSQAGYIDCNNKALQKHATCRQWSLGDCD